MNNATMLYRCPGPHMTDGIAYEYVIVDESEVQAKLADGWFTDWAQADAAVKAAAAKLQANEEEMAGIEKALAAAGMKAVHKGRGVWAVQDAEGNEIASGLSKEEAQAQAAPSAAPAAAAPEQVPTGG